MGFVSVNGTELYYERYGSGDSLIFCHGDGRDHRAWMPQVEALASDYEVIAYDLNGYGRSGGSDRSRQFFDVHAEDLYGLIDALNITRPAVVGWSMGGRVAYTVAARHPEVLDALVVLEPASQKVSDPPLVLDLLLRSGPTVASIVGWPRLLALRRWLRNVRGESDRYAETVVEGLGIPKSEYAADAEAHVDTAEYNKMLAGILREMGGDEQAVVEFSSISVPVLGLAGAESHERYEQRIEALTSETPDARRETIPDAGHAAHIDNAAEFNCILRNFLSDALQARPENNER